MNSVVKVLCRRSFLRKFSLSSATLNVETLTIPVSDNEIPPVSPKISKLVDEIAKLNLLEVSELSSTLKRTLNLPDAPMMSFGAAAPQKTEEDEDVAPKIVKTSYTVKLTAFDDGKKVSLIKEIKGLLQDMNLVQAKKFVESAPTIVKSDIGKDEAEKIKEQLEKVGGTCEIA